MLSILVRFKSLWKRLGQTPISGLTVDAADLKIATNYLKKPKQWNDEAIIRQYEKDFSNWNQSRFAYSFISGRVALSAAIAALGLQRGDTVIISAYTCVVVANAFRYEGIDLLFCDIELDTYGLDAEKLITLIRENTNVKAIVLQHLYGLVARDYEKTINIARQNNLFVIEDCAHSMGATFKGKPVGNLGDVAFYSSEQSKVINTFCGGLLSTNDESVATKVSEYQFKTPYPNNLLIKKYLTNYIFNYYTQVHHWRKFYYLPLRFWYKNMLFKTTSEAEIDGIKPFNYQMRLPAPLAALGISQLQKIVAINQKRFQNAKKWDAWAMENQFPKPLIIPDSVPIFLRYPLLVEESMKQNHDWAKKLNIEVGVWFLSPLHPRPMLLDDCPNAMAAVKRCINFPTLV